MTRELIRWVDRVLRASASVTDQLTRVGIGIEQRLLTGGTGDPRGEMPAAWRVKPLGDVARFACGKTKPRDAAHLRSPTNFVPIYGGKGLLGFSGTALRRGATIVIGRLGAHCGEFHFVPDEESWITDNALFVYETRPEVDLRFLYYSLRRLDPAALRTTGRQPLISLSTIYPVLVALPPLEEQRRICEVLLSMEALREAEDKVLVQAKRVRSVLAEGGAIGGVGLGETPG
jgi:restriction endonuclease S subunit